MDWSDRAKLILQEQDTDMQAKKRSCLYQRYIYIQLIKTE